MPICFHCRRPLNRPNVLGKNAERHYCKAYECRKAYHRWLLQRGKVNAHA